MELTERFADVVSRNPVPLDEAVALIGAHAGSDAAVDHVLDGLDAIAGQVGDPSLEPLLQTLFVDLGYAGDQDDYYDPRNSYLHEVIERRRGIPITLSVVVIEVARRLGIELHGLGTPAHFMVLVPSEPPRFVDAFAGGRVLDRTGLDRLFARLAPGVDLAPYLSPLPPREVVRRVLGNLVAVHRERGDRDALLWSTQLRTLVPGSSADDERTFGGALAATGDFARAAKVLERLAGRGDSADAERALAEARQLRARLN